jgi:predicted nucleic acid-binding protein
LIVVDASVVVDALAGSDAQASMVRQRLIDEGEAHVPHLLDVEVTSALRRLCRAGSIDETQATLALDDLAQLSLVRYPHLPLLARVWDLRRAVTAYDAMYVALAEILGCALLTADARLARTAGALCPIDIVRAPRGRK